ncbi:hypothetical protein ASC75_16135 [Aminobacter sp. DSM 101952]|uniref:CopG family ribbon-helix-helix protein n=1 Tax=Aminobacter sp. DSM 101952 TaxID=2735891 RepID=UPI0006FBFF0E|nr:hypothetical protein [Aminobacter sp. DSM 101952]KQU62710.1 hypothetical protein ASC75_16135 [Aminobacter sp. DSM 101952]
MGEVPLSLHVTKQLKQELEQEAERQNLSADDVAQRAIRAYLDSQSIERDVLDERIAEANTGIFISEKAMLDWMERLEDDAGALAPAPDVFVQRSK